MNPFLQECLDQPINRDIIPIFLDFMNFEEMIFMKRFYEFFNEEIMKRFYENRKFEIILLSDKIVNICTVCSNSYCNFVVNLLSHIEVRGLFISEKGFFFKL